MGGVSGLVRAAALSRARTGDTLSRSIFWETMISSVLINTALPRPWDSQGRE